MRINPDDFDRAAIRRTVHEFYERKAYPTLTTLLASVRQKGVFEGGRTALAMLLKNIGFRHCKRNDKVYFYERPEIIRQRHSFLRSIKKYREEGRPLVFLDETWANAHISKERIWLDDSGRGGWKRPSGRGQRLIILHAGSKNGWIPGASLVFRSKKSSGDYHDEMNAKHFNEWFEHQLLPHCPDQSVIILDNAPYHNAVTEKIPTKSSRKGEMQAWLTKHQIDWDVHDLKRELYEKIRRAAPKKSFVTNRLASDRGFVVLRSPVAHCELNPIELAWSQVKGFLRKNNTTFKLKDLEELVPQAFEAVTQTMWEAFCGHAEKEERRFWEKDGLQEEAVDDFVIRFDVSDDEDESDDATATSRLCDDPSEGESSDEDDDYDENDRCLLETDRVTDMT
ncbi:uncharacterized protein [Oscarella lobularis]|uniref:uncharacterized protein n=1 Tax=Oscarella lobularis TaxID=121494 RepID=UPI003313D132